MKKAFLTICFIAVTVALTAQQWNIAIDHYETDSQLLDGCCTDNNETVFVGVWDTEAYAIKIDEHGNYTQKFFSRDNRSSRFHSIIPIENGNYFVTGVSITNDIEYLWVLVLDNDMNIVKEQYYEKEEEYSGPDVTFYNGENCKAVVDDDGTIVVCVGVRMPFLPQTYRTRPVFMRFNTDCDRLNSVFIASDDYGNLFYDTNFWLTSIMNDPDNNDILVVGPGQGNCSSVMRFDYDFNLIMHHVFYEHIVDKIVSEAISDHIIDDNDILVLGWITDPDIHNKHMIVYGKADINNGYIYEDLWINKPDTLNYTIDNHSMCYVNDTTIYLASRARLHYWGGPYALELYLVTKNLEILGSKYFYDETGYWPKTAIATKDDGIVAVSTSRSERTYIKKLLREDFNPIPCSVSEVPKEKIKAAAFPNPTKGEINIDISKISTIDSDVRFRIFNADGRICLDRIINGMGNLLTVDVSSLPDGTYTFQIVKGNKNIISDKFIKE